MKNTINNKLRRLPGMLAGLLLFAAAACTPESLRPDYETDHSARSAMTLEFGVSATEVGIRTRAVADEDDPLAGAFESSEVKSLWIGIFDVETGNLVGKMHTMKIDYENNGKVEPDKGYKPETNMATVDILYYDAHPTVRIFGVANFEGVKARSGMDEFSDLSEKLETVQSMSDFFAISVNAESADAALEESGTPLMMGVYMTDANHKDQKGLFAVAAEGNGKFTTATKTADIKLVDEKYDRIESDKDTKQILKGGSIRLRRLLSQVNVEVKAGDGITLSNMQFRKFNMPQEVYLQERETYTGETKFFNTWSLKSPNKADALLVMGAADFGNVAEIPAYAYKSDKNDRDEGFTGVNDEMAVRFYQYENKHWGQSGVTPANREATRAMTDINKNPVFVALCGPDSETQNVVATIYNNYASYFEIKLDVVDANKDMRGTVTYRIHEGFCNDEHGFERLQENAARDFSCVRNTKYKYTITIKGLESFDVTAETGHSHGTGIVGGELLSIAKGGDHQIDAEDPTSFNGKVVDFVCYYENDGEPVIYGSNPDSRLLELPALSAVKGNWKTPEELEDLGLNFGFTVGGEDLRELSIDDTVLDGEITTIYANEGKEGHFKPKSHLHALYLLVDASDPDDPWCTNYQYYRYYYLPEDTRLFITDDADFQLQFQNKWDSALSADNGAVNGYIEDIALSLNETPTWQTEGQTEPAKPYYKVYFDDNKKTPIWEGETWPANPLSIINEEIKASLTENKLYYVSVVISDLTEQYQDYDSPEIPFMIYPTKFTWDYKEWSWLDTDTKAQPGEKAISGAAKSGTLFFGNNIHNSDADKFAGIKHCKNMDIGLSSDGITHYLQTGGSDREQNAIEINALYDAILTVYPSATGNSWNYTRYLKVTNTIGSSQISDEKTFAAIPAGNPVGPSIPYHFYVKKGTVNIFSGGSLNLYKIELTYIGRSDAPGDRIWDFSDSQWGELFYTFNDGTDYYPVSRMVDGLHIETNDDASKALRFNKTSHYIDLRGNGDINKMSRIFWFDAYKPGKVKVYAGSGSNGSERTMFVYDGEKEQEAIKTNSTGRPATTNGVEIENVDETHPKRVYIYARGGGMFVYRIEFTEKKQ